MWNEYAREKIHQLERERRRMSEQPPPDAAHRPRRRGVPFARGVGRALQALGVAIQQRGASPPEATRDRWG